VTYGDGGVLIDLSGRFQLLNSFSRSILAFLEGLQELPVEATVHPIEAIELPVEGPKLPVEGEIMT